MLVGDNPGNRLSIAHSSLHNYNSCVIRYPSTNFQVSIQPIVLRPNRLFAIFVVRAVEFRTQSDPMNWSEIEAENVRVLEGLLSLKPVEMVIVESVVGHPKALLKIREIPAIIFMISSDDHVGNLEKM